jgi:hypothetical protein
MNVTVVWAAPGVQDVVPVVLSPGETVDHAVTRSGLIERYALDAGELRFAVFGRTARADSELAEGDRVEITRPLVADPKESRRRRALSQPLAKPVHASKRRRQG